MKTILTLCAILPTALFAVLPSPIAWWRMDSASNGVVADSSGNGRDLTFATGCSLVNDAPSGTALSFDGTTKALASFDAPEGLTGARTFSMWIRRDQDDGSVQVNYAYLLYGCGSLYLRNTRSSGVCALFVPGSGSSVVSSCLGSRGKWQHLVVVIETTPSETEGKVLLTAREYVNGGLASISTNREVDQLDYTAGTAFLGNYNVHGGYPFKGAIDEVKLFDCALTYAQVREEFARYDAGKPRLIGHWPMDSISVDGDGVAWSFDDSGELPLRLTGCSVTNGPLSESSALWFDGKSGTFALFTMPDGGSSFTWSGWMFHPAASASTQLPGNTYPRMLATETGTALYLYENTTATEYLRLYTSMAGVGDLFAGVQPAATGRDEWCHFTFIAKTEPNAYGNAEMSIVWYLNGEKMGETAPKPVTGKFDPIAGTWWHFGGGAAARPFWGGMCDVRLFNGALTPEQVRQVYSGAAAVSAGGDFSTAGSSVTLHGTRSSYGNTPNSFAPDGDTVWTLVSCPEGGEGAKISHPERLVTEATLPVDGTYVFRLSSVSFGGTRSDTVSVTRDSSLSPAALSVSITAPSTIELPAPLVLKATAAPASDSVRFRWSRKSGSGGVWFSPESGKSTYAVFSAAGSYELQCVADDGVTCATGTVSVTVTGSDASYPDAGLAAYWNFDVRQWEELSRTTNYFVGGIYTNCGLYGKCPRARTSETKIASIDTRRILPIDEGMSLSMWIYHDTTDPDESATTYARVVDFGVFHIQFNAGTIPNTPFSLNVYSATGKKSYWSLYPANYISTGYMTNRWTHIAFSFDQRDFTGNTAAFASRMKIYVDGEEIGSRVNPVVGEPLEDDGTFSFRRKTVNTGNGRLIGLETANRFFPGRIDEVRYYTNTLTEAQVLRLYREAKHGNRPPVIDVISPLAREVTLTAHSPLALSVAVYDDGMPKGSAVESEWVLTSGNEEKSSLPDTLSGAATFGSPGTYKIRLTATDGARSAASDEITVNVIPRGMSIQIR